MKQTRQFEFARQVPQPFPALKGLTQYVDSLGNKRSALRQAIHFIGGFASCLNTRQALVTASNKPACTLAEVASSCVAL
jgi:hypothetical protein